MGDIRVSPEVRASSFAAWLAHRILVEGWLEIQDKHTLQQYKRVKYLSQLKQNDSLPIVQLLGVEIRVHQDDPQLCCLGRNQLYSLYPATQRTLPSSQDATDPFNITPATEDTVS